MNGIDWEGRRDEYEKVMMWIIMEYSLVQILVEVANIQKRSLKTEVEKGSIGIVLIYGLVGPKRKVKSVMIVVFKLL